MKTLYIGRILRFLLGVWFIFVIASWYNSSDFFSILSALGIAGGLLLFYLLLDLLISNYVPDLNRWVGAVFAAIPVLLIYFLGGTLGQVGALSFVGISLIFSGLRGDPGCEVMSIPGIIFKRHTHLGCLLFSPIDWFEFKLYSYIKGHTNDKRN